MLDTFSYFLSLKKKKNGQGEKWGGEKKKDFTVMTRTHLQLGGICSPHVTSLINKQLN